MRKRTDLGFASIRIEGGILPAEFFQKLVALEGKNQKPGDYGLEKGISVRDEIGRAWRSSLVEWQKYRARRTRLNVSPTEVGVRNWLLRLLSIVGFSDMQALRPLQQELYPQGSRRHKPQDSSPRANSIRGADGR